jgi:hypothetical protein
MPRPAWPEVYSISNCDQFPNMAFTQMSGIKLRTGTTTPTVRWTPNKLQPSCGVQSVIVKNGGKHVKFLAFRNLRAEACAQWLGSVPVSDFCSARWPSCSFWEVTG